MTWPLTPTGSVADGAVERRDLIEEGPSHFNPPLAACTLSNDLSQGAAVPSRSADTISDTERDAR